MKHFYTLTKVSTSTCERKLACITPAGFIPAIFYANPFTIWTDPDNTDGAATAAAVTVHTKTVYKTVYRSRNNRATRKACEREKADVIFNLITRV